MSKNVKEVNKADNPDLSFDEIRKKEIRLSWLPTFGIPIPSFAIVVFLFLTNYSELVWVVLFGTGLFYSIFFSLFFLPTDKKYSARHPIRSATAFFNKVGYERMVLRWEIWANRTSEYIQFMIFVCAFVAVMVSVLSIAKTHSEVIETTKNFLYSLVLIPATMLYIPLFFRAPLTAHNDFGLCYSIGCFKIVKKFKELDDIRKTRYMIEGFKYYDYYIKKNLKLRINNLEIFHTIILGNSKESMDKMSETILNKLEKGEKLDLLRYMISLSGISEDKPLLVSEKLSEKLKNWYQIILSVAAFVVAIIQLVK